MGRKGEAAERCSTSRLRFVVDSLSWISKERGKHKGYWVVDSATDAQINGDKGTVQLTGTNDGTDHTHAFYQDTSVYVGWDANTSWNPAGHVAIAFPGQTPVGFNPLSDTQFQHPRCRDIAETIVSGPSVVKSSVDATTGDGSLSRKRLELSMLLDGIDWRHVENMCARECG